MTSEDNTSEHTAPADDASSEPRAPRDQKPLGYWLRTVDALLTQEFATAFDTASDGSGAGRRDWMILNVLSGDVDAPGFAERLARKGKRLSGLAERGWVQQQGDGTWTITDEGRAAQARLSEVVEGIRSRVAGAVSPEDFATTMASLETIARELGWDENAPRAHRGFRRGFGPGFGSWRGRGQFAGRAGFGPWSRDGQPEPADGEIRDGHGHNRHRGFGPGFGPRGPRPAGAPEDGFDPAGAHAQCGHGHGHGHGFGPGHGHGHGFGPGHGHGHGFGPGEHRGEHRRGRDGSRDGRGAERAYERGFDAGFARGSTAAAASDAV